ncbi:Uma2 family endonuclease [Streptomyces sp. NPDC097727]|uniref:Uma2 family endonuclease n=1 Tax=Streptomyces sp. NPDC097727 TaxID=3366092 RepID=UPI0038006A70
MRLVLSSWTMTAATGSASSPQHRHEQRAAKDGEAGDVRDTGTPDVEAEAEAEGIMRHPDVMVTGVDDMEGQGAFDPRTLIAAIEIVSQSNPDNDWVSKMRDHPLLGIPVYAIFDPHTGTGAVLSEIHPTPEGPRYAIRKDFVYGEDVTIGEWTISTDALPRYA